MNQTNKKLMVYGANGYSAKLIIEELLSRGIKPVIAGRDKEKIITLAEQYSCEYLVFGLEEESIIDSAIKDFHTIINCAGPFKYTAKELIESCIRTKTNYLDITGEIPVFHLAFSKSEKAKESGIIIMPGVGFDIIPTDCLAKRLSEKMPDAVNLKLGFLNKKGKISRGTWLTTLEFLGGTGLIRRDGKIVESEIGQYSIKFKKGKISFYGLSIPWGDVYTSYQSTKILNAEIYFGVPFIVYQLRKILTPLLKLFRIPLIKSITSYFIKKNLTGPDKNQRDSTKTYLWGRVENTKGEMIEEIYRIMEGYNLTALGAAECAERVLNNFVEPGTLTPSMAFGSDFLDLFVMKEDSDIK